MRMTASEIIDRELKAQGSSLAEWAHANGYTRDKVAYMIDGESAPRFTVVSRLADALGVTWESLPATVSA